MTRRLPRPDHAKLWEAYLTARTALLVKHNGKLSAEGIAHRAAEQARADIVEFRRLTRGVV